MSVYRARPDLAGPVIKYKTVSIYKSQLNSNISRVKNTNSKFDGYEGFANLLREYVNIEHYLKM